MKALLNPGQTGCSFTRHQTAGILSGRPGAAGRTSLASRFGVTIYYAKPNAGEYLNIVRELTKRNGIEIGEKELSDIARKWELRHGGMSGRTASQLITWLRGEAARLKEK